MRERRDRRVGAFEVSNGVQSDKELGIRVLQVGIISESKAMDRNPQRGKAQPKPKEIEIDSTAKHGAQNSEHGHASE